jgi:peptide-methionine (S)-S-oxide reductase
MQPFASLTAFARLTVLTCGLALASTATLAQKVPTEIATFAGGCFWCVEVDFDKVDGVVATTSGFMGGKSDKASYQDVSAGKTGHTEVVNVEFDPTKVSYEKLVYVFWRTIDPLDAGGQFCDRGDMYRTGIFTHSPAQKAVADATKAELTKSARFKQPIVTEITPASAFIAAEAYHQDFYKKSPGRYYSYRAGCGRDARVKALWGAEAGGKVATQ